MKKVFIAVVSLSISFGLLSMDDTTPEGRVQILRKILKGDSKSGKKRDNKPKKEVKDESEAGAKEPWNGVMKELLTTLKATSLEIQPAQKEPGGNN